MQALVDWIISWTVDGKFAILIFPLLGALLIFSSMRLVNFAEALILKTKLNGGFVGGALVAGVTSMPELITEITQATAGHPEHGTGDNLGSNAFNTFLIAIGALLFVRYLFLNNLPWWTRVTLGLSLGGALAMSLFLGLNRWLGFADINSSYLGIVPALFFVFYLITLGLNYRFGSADEVESTPVHRAKRLRVIFGWFIFWSIILVGSSVLVNADVNAFQHGLGIPTESVGGIFLAITTSAPEVVAFFIFLRRRQPAAAVASIAGSHFFNLGIAFFGDLAYTPGPSFNNAQMGKHLPLAIITSLSLFFIVLHFILARKFPRLFHRRSVYLILPSLTICSYILGWSLTLVFN